MKIVPPLAITGDNLVDTNVTETLPIWDKDTNYDLAAQVRVVQSDGSGIAYESLIAGNLNKSPADNPAEWLETGPTNLWAMFDGKYGTRTLQDGSVDVTIAATGRADSLALLNLAGTTVDVVVSDDADNVLYDETYSLVSTDGIDNWYDYFFAPIEQSDSLFLTDLPINFNPTVRVTINYPEGTAAVGWFVLGRMIDLGITEQGIKLGIVDYSRKDTDDFGNFTLVERPFSRTVEARVWVPKGRVDPVYKLLGQYRATPVVWVPTETYISSIIPGFYRDFSIGIEYPTHSICNIEIEGLT